MDRQKWEYVFLEIDLLAGDRPLIRYINGQEIEQWKQGLLLWERLNVLGDDGWELVTVELVGKRHPSLIMKRPKS